MIPVQNVPYVFFILSRKRLMVGLLSELVRASKGKPHERPKGNSWRPGTTHSGDGETVPKREWWGGEPKRWS